MDQRKIGQFLRMLRKEKTVTQEQLAEILGVSSRSISRWENGVTMPDFDLLIQIAEYYNVEIGELLDGKRKGETMDKKTEETIIKAVDYNNTEKMVFSKRLRNMFIGGLAAFVVYMAIDIAGLSEIKMYEGIASFMLGIVFGVLLLGVLYSSRCMIKIKALKLRLLKRIRQLP